MPEDRTLLACQSVVDAARLATGSRLVHLTRLDRQANRVRSEAWSGINLGLAAAALEVVRLLFPHFDPYRISPPPNLNPCNERVYARGEPLLAGFEEVALNAVDHRILALVIGITKIRYSYLHPLWLEDEIAGALVFHAAVFGPEQIEIARRFVPEAERALSAHITGSAYVPERPD